MRLPLLVALLALAPPAAAQTTTSLAPVLDFEIDLRPGQAPAVKDPTGILELVANVSGERVAWNVTLTREYTTAEVRIHPGAFDVARPRQVVPHLHVPSTVYTLFEPVAYADVWNADGPARIANVTVADGVVVLRLGFPGPENGSFELVRDVTPPGYTLGPITNVTTYSFYQETTTDELALGDLQVRKPGAPDWIQNPTPQYHVRQRFPVQGLDPDTRYDLRLVFTDWAGNAVTTPAYVVRTAPLPDVPLPLVTPLSPPPNATLPPGSSVVVRASIDPRGGALEPGSVRVYFDKREIASHDFTFDGANVTYVPNVALQPGPHSASVEVRNAIGQRAHAAWSFHVEEVRESPGAPALAALALALVLALALRPAPRPRR